MSYEEIRLLERLGEHVLEVLGLSPQWKIETG